MLWIKKLLYKLLQDNKLESRVVSNWYEVSYNCLLLLIIIIIIIITDWLCFMKKFDCSCVSIVWVARVLTHTRLVQ